MLRNNGEEEQEGQHLQTVCHTPNKSGFQYSALTPRLVSLIVLSCAQRLTSNDQEVSMFDPIQHPSMHGWIQILLQHYKQPIAITNMHPHGWISIDTTSALALTRAAPIMAGAHQWRWYRCIAGACGLLESAARMREDVDRHSCVAITMAVSPQYKPKASPLVYGCCHLSSTVVLGP